MIFAFFRLNKEIIPFITHINDNSTIASDKKIHSGALTTFSLWKHTLLRNGSRPPRSRFQQLVELLKINDETKKNCNHE